MATNSMFGVQPFEELAQEEPPASPTSLEDFYREQERKDLERRISRIRRRRRGSSRASEPDTPANEQPQILLPPVYQGQPLQQQLQQQQQQQWQDQLPQPQQWQDQPPPPQLAWQQNQQSGNWWTHESTFKTRYEIHNPTPNPYPWVNHHLLPPGTTFPPTIKPPRKSPPNSYNFTPSLLDSLPHPRETLGATSTSSSSTSTFPRSRSVTNLGTTSALHHDNVDFLDASDPWGLRWHHDGRYDVGDFVSASRAPPLPGTTSLPSDPNRFKTRQGVRRSGPLPSPLSQSTSATQLPLSLEQSKDAPPLTRKLSKRHSANAVATTPIPSSLTPTSERHLFSGTVPGPSAFKLKTKRGSVLRFFGISSNGHSQESTTKNAFLSAPESSDRRWLERRRSQTLPSSSHPAAHQQSERGFQVLRRPTADANTRHITQRPNIPPSASEPHILGVDGNGGNGGTSPSNKDNYLNAPPSNNNNGMLSVPQAANPKEKRGSALGRLVKKLSLVKKDNSNEWERQGGLAFGVNETVKRSSTNVQTQGLESGGKGSRAVTPNDYSAGEDSTSQQHHAQDQPASSRTGPFGSASELECGQSGHGGTGEGLVPSYPHQLVEHISNQDQQQHQPSPTRPIPDSPEQQQQQTSKPDTQLSRLLPQDEEHNTPPRTPFRGQELERERGRRDSYDGHSSPELQYTVQLGGLMVTNPDLTSDTGSMLGNSPRPELQQRQNGQLFVPRAPFALKPGMLSSAESSPHTPFVPLRKVTNPDPETETEGGTLKRPNTAITSSRPTTEVVVPPLPEVKRESVVRTPTQDVERKSEERERVFKPVHRDPRLLALAEILNPSARKPIPERSGSPAKDEDLMLVFTSSPLAENDDTDAYIKSPKSSTTIDEIMDLSLEPPQPTFSPSGMTTVLVGLQSPKGHLQQPTKLEPFVDPLDDKPLPAILPSRNPSIMSRATTVPPTPPPKSFAQLARLAAPRLAPTDRVPLGTEEISPLPSPSLTSPPARPTRNSSRVASPTSPSPKLVHHAASTPASSRTPTPGRLSSTPVVRSPSPRVPSSPSIGTIPSPGSLKAPSTLPDPAMLAPPSPGSESTLTTPALSAMPTIPSPAVTYVPVPVYIPVLPPPIPTKPVPRPAPSPNPLPSPPAPISRPTNDREGSTRPKFAHTNSYHASSSFATTAPAPAVKRPISLEAQLPPYSIAQALEKTPSTVSGYTTAPEALGRARTQSTGVSAPLDAPVSRSKSKKEKIPALGTDWEVIEAIMMQSPDSPTPPNAPISPTSPVVKRGSSNHVQQAPTSGSGSGSQWRREERERLSINGSSDARQDGSHSSRQDGYPARLDSYSAQRLDGYSPVQGGYGSNKSPSHSRTGSGDVREARERERAKESNKILHRSPTAPAAPVKSSSPTFQEKARGPERLVKSKSRRDRERERELEREREKEKELSRRTSQLAPSGTLKLRSKMGDPRAEQDPSKSALNSNLSTRRVRPTSDVAVETTEQLRAQEAWEHARITGIRGQSVVMPDRFSVAPPPPQTIPSHTQGQYQPPAGSPPPQYPQSQQHQNDYLPRGAAGSSHTQFVVEPPFQQHPQGQQQQQPPRLGAWPAYQYRQYSYYPVQQRQTQPVDPNPLPPPPAQINYPPQRVNR